MRLICDHATKKCVIDLKLKSHKRKIMSNGDSGTIWKWLVGLSGAALVIYLIDKAVRENTIYYCPNPDKDHDKKEGILEIPIIKPSDGR